MPEPSLGTQSARILDPADRRQWACTRARVVLASCLFSQLPPGSHFLVRRNSSPSYCLTQISPWVRMHPRRRHHLLSAGFESEARRKAAHGSTALNRSDERRVGKWSPLG